MKEIEINQAIGNQDQPTRRKILFALKQRGGMTAAELARLLGITSMGVRRHLSTLERDRLVHYDLVQRGKGRPSYVYRLTPEAEGLFPKNYAALANELLDYLATTAGDRTVIELFDQRALRRVRQAQAQLAGQSLGERVAGLTDILSSEGYLAEWAQLAPGAFIIREYNCAIHDIAAEHRAACNSELSFLRAILPDAEVTREAHIMAGGLCCAYRICQREHLAA